MTDREAIRKVIEQAYAERARGNVKGVMDLFHADAVFELVGEKKALALTGAVRGHPSVQEAITQLIGNFEFIERDIISFIADGDRASVRSRLKIRFAPKNLTFTTELTDLFKFQDGKIIELVEFADTALLKEITGT